MADNLVLLFVEGPTEVEFYKAVVMKARSIMAVPFSCEIKYIDISGIGNYKTKALRKFDHIKKENPNKAISVFLCIDHDVFLSGTNPPFNKNELRKTLLEKGALKVTYIEAKQSIEDWFLCDLSGVLTYLRLPQKTNRPGGNGQSSLKTLFKMANKLYIKGSKTEGFIEKLNIQTIMQPCCFQLMPLCKCLNLDCKKICYK